MVFLVALVPRVVYPVSRPPQWYTRSVMFWDALLTGDLGGTYQQYHPGVTTMWVAGLGLRIYAAAHGWSTEELLYPPSLPSGLKPDATWAGVAALGVVISLCICLASWLTARLAGLRVGLVGGLLLALDPYLLTHSKALHLDAMVAILMLVSALLLVGYAETRKRTYLALSGVFAGLALLTKSPAAFLLPFAGVVIMYRNLSSQQASAAWIDREAWATRARRVVRDTVVWLLVVCGVFLLLWPAMWVTPVDILSKMTQNTARHAETVHHNPSFFAGQVVAGDVGPLFYPAVVAWKTTLVTLPALCASVPLLLWRTRRGKRERLAWLLLFFACGFAGAMTLAAKKEMRYLLPMFPALSVLAGWSLVRGARAIGQRVSSGKRGQVPAIIVTIALAVQAIATLRHHPYYGTHHNLLLGGSRVAQRMLTLGSQAEGLDQAARFLNGYPGADRMAVGAQDENDRTYFQRIFIGETRPTDDPHLDYWVFAVNPTQRENGIEDWGSIWEANRQAEPMWSVSFNSVPYVWIYRTYPHDPALFPIAHRTDIQFGTHIQLVGYEASANELATGDILTMTLLYQSDGRVVEDGHVFVHLADAAGQLAAQHDGVPVNGRRPTWTWRDAEMVQDQHGIIIVSDLPPGTYSVSTGMYDFATGIRLPAVTAAGERLPGDSVPVGLIKLTGG